MKDVDLEEPTSFLDHVSFGCTQRECRISKDIVDNCRIKIGSKISAGAQENSSFREFGCKYFFMVPWRGRWCKEVRGKTMPTGKQNNATMIRSRNTMHWWPSIQWRREKICGRIIYSLLADCSEMLFLGTYWLAWYPMVREETCSCIKKMDRQRRVTNV